MNWPLNKNKKKCLISKTFRLDQRPSSDELCIILSIIFQLDPLNKTITNQAYERLFSMETGNANIGKSQTTIEPTGWKWSERNTHSVQTKFIRISNNFAQMNFNRFPLTNWVSQSRFKYWLFDWKSSRMMLCER